jgi:hypothetical protein
MIRTLILGVIALLLVVGLGTVLASEFGGEVVVLHTTDSSGASYQTSLWIVEDENEDLWLRSGDPNSGWLIRLEDNPSVKLTRDDEVEHYRAVIFMEQVDHVNDLMAADYGMADQLMGLQRDPESIVPIRLDLVQEDY